jgi:hypothetical protein
MTIIHFDPVEPGDLITAALMNRLFTAVESLAVRVEELEGGGGATPVNAPAISSRIPTGEVPVGSQLTLLGRNFLIPSDQNTVSMGSVTINQFLPFSSETTLSFSVPNLFPSLPADVPVTVTNRNGTSIPVTVRVTPLVQIPHGEVKVVDTTPNLGVIETVDTRPAGYNLTFTVSPHTTLAETYEFSVVYTNVTGASLAAWQVTPSGPQVITNESPRTATVHVAVPTGATSVDMALHVRSLHNNTELSTSSDVVHLVIGQAPEVSHPGVTFTLEPVFNPAPSDTARAATINGLAGYEVKFNGSGTLPVTAHFDAPATAGLYRFTAQVEQTGGLWSNPTVAPAQNAEVVPGEENLAVQVSSTTAGPDPAIRNLVVRATKRNAANTADEFTSFRRFPIRGYAS